MSRVVTSQVVALLACFFILVSCSGSSDSTDAVNDQMTDTDDAKAGGDLKAADVPTVEVCTPQCLGKVCGDDGCQGQCGACMEGWDCVEGQCQQLCVPQCEFKDCGDDGCDGNCGTCPPPLFCVDAVCACVSMCQGKECGTDGCGGSCGECQEPYACDFGKCECAYGVCAVGDDLDEVCGNLALGNCETWGCENECCVTVETPPPVCCQTTEDCRDCVNLESGETVDCPTAVPEGYVQNKCTKDVCGFGNECKHFDKVVFGECNDDDDCTNDTCIFETGKCVNTPVEDDPECPPIEPQE